MLGPRRVWWTGAVVVALGLVYWLFVATPPGPRDPRVFDPDRTAALEVDMWKAYYDKRNVAAFHLARAAATFARLRGDYDQVLPDLETAYALARDWTEAAYDPAAVARAELAWWVARRHPPRHRRRRRRLAGGVAALARVVSIAARRGEPAAVTAPRRARAPRLQVG